MPERPRLSLCVPTYNRADYLEGALLSGLREAAGQPSGTVEVLVCDNGSSDATPELIARLRAAYPELLRVQRHPENLGFDRNYLSCLEQARGEFVWVMGDDDEWKPGSIARVLRELDAGADACLCLAEACDLELNPVAVLCWYLDADGPTVWHLRNREDLIRYFDGCAYNAGVFAFISVAIIRRERFLEQRQWIQKAMGNGYVHLWGMMGCLRQPLCLHYVPEVLVRNRLGGLHPGATTSARLYDQWMHDLWSWVNIADEVFGDDPELHGAFSRIVGRNHHNTVLPGLRQHAPDQAAWKAASFPLTRAGFSPVRIAATDFGYRHLFGERLPMPTLDPAGLCLADLALVARGARHIAVLALGGLPNLFDGAALLGALRGLDGDRRIMVCCPAACAPLLDGFAVHGVEPVRYARDAVYREAMVRRLVDFAPELVVNLDPERSVQADDLVNAALPAGAVAYELPERGQDARLRQAANGAYSRLVPRGAGGALGAALGLPAGRPALWPAPSAVAQAEALLAGPWDPATTLAVLVDAAPEAEDPAFQAALARAAAAGWTFLGLGSRSGYGPLEALLGPLEERAMNLAGVMELDVTAALLQRVGGSLGGTGMLGALATACGCLRLGFVGAAEH
jgi:glycosyltransferase involved in cell wall biosynthesis